MNWWRIARMELMLALRDKEAVIWSFVMPFAFAWFFGFVAGGSSGPPGPTSVRLVTNDNPVYVDQLFRGFLANRNVQLTDNEEVSRLVLPDRLISCLLAGEAATVTLEKQNTSALRSQELSIKAQQVTHTLAMRADPSWITSPPDSATVAALVGSEGPIRLESDALGFRRPIAGGVNHTLPAMLVMFLMFQLLTYFLAQWVQDITSGKMKRITLSPVHTGHVFAGEMAARMIWCLVQVVIIGALGPILLRANLGVPLHYAFALTLIYMVVSSALGLFLATFFDTVEKANAVGVIAGLMLAALGGCWWPLEIVPDFMKTLANLIPTGVMMDAFADMYAQGPSADFPLENAIRLTIMAVVLIPLAIFRMRTQLVR